MKDNFVGKSGFLWFLLKQFEIVVPVKIDVKNNFRFQKVAINYEQGWVQFLSPTIWLIKEKKYLTFSHFMKNRGLTFVEM